MMIFWAVLLAVIVWGVVAIVRNANRSSQMPPHSETPLDVLRRRYASGEINKEQFEEIKHALGD